MKVSPYLMRPLRTLDQVLDDSGGEAPPAGSEANGQAEGAAEGKGNSRGARRALTSREDETGPTRSAAAE